MQIPPSSPAFNPAPGSTPGDASSQNAINGTITALAAAAAPHVAATAPIGDSPTQQQLALTLDAMGYLAAIHMALQKEGQTPQPIALYYANKLYSECYGKCTPAMNTIISQMAIDFTLSGGKVTHVYKDGFIVDWTQPTSKDVGGIQQIFQNVLSAQPNPLGSLGINGSNAMSTALFFLFLSDTMMCPTVASSTEKYQFGGQSYNLSDFIWGNSSQGHYTGGQWGGMYLQDLLPMIVGTAFYQQDANGGQGAAGYSKFQSDLSNFIGLFPTQAQLATAYSGSTEPDFTGYLEGLDKLNSLLTDYPPQKPSNCTFPPASWITTLSSPPYNWNPIIIKDYFQEANNTFGTQCDMSDFFSLVVTGCFDGFVSPGPF